MLLAPEVPFSIDVLTLGDGIEGTWQTVAVMRRLARRGSRDARIRSSAVRVIWMQPAKSELHEVTALFEFVRDRIRYVRDPLCFESVAEPFKVLELGHGDCDDKATLLAAMLESIGYPTRFVVAGYRVPMPEHVYLQVFAGGEWIDADATESHALGYAPPHPVYLEFERV
jgi:transglutaminase-like putative cysteine protease